MHEQFDARLDRLVKNSQVGQEVLGDVLSRVALRAPAETSRVEIASGPQMKDDPEQEDDRAELRGIPQGTVSKAVKAFMTEGLLEDGETLLRWEGRVVSPLRLGGAFGIAGAKVTLRDGHPDTVIAGLTRLDGETLLLGQPRIFSQPASDPWGDVARVLHEEITQLQHKHDRTRAKEGREPLKLLGVGVEVGAHVHDGHVIRSPGVGWHGDAPLADTLAKLFEDSTPKDSIPVVVENDVNALAVLATHQMHYTESNLVVVAVFDEGIGGGLVMDGRLRRGGNGMAMEIGHLTVGYAPGMPQDAVNDASAGGTNPSLSDFNPCCPCGEVGHLDAFATPKRIRQALHVGTNEEAAQAPASIESGKPTHHHAIFQSAGAVLGRGLAHVINIVNPSRLVLYMPAELAEPAPSTAATAYLTAAKQEMEQAAYSTGACDAHLTPEAIHSDETLELGVRAAAFCVFNSFIDHARGHDGCRTRRRTN